MFSERLSVFSARAIMLALAASFVCLAQTPASKFTGTWRENQSKTKLSPS